MDEPRQQETSKISVAGLLRRLSDVNQFGQQAIFATSEDPDEVGAMLQNLPHKLLDMREKKPLTPLGDLPH